MSPAKKEYIIVSVVCNEYQISVDDLTNPSPTRATPAKFFEPKMVVMHFIRVNTFYTMARINPVVGFSPMAHSRQSVDNFIHNKTFADPSFKKRMAKIEAILPEIFNIHK